MGKWQRGETWTPEENAYLDRVRANDHIHPSEAGCRKVTGQLLKFLKTDPGARLWFLKPGT